MNRVVLCLFIGTLATFFASPAWAQFDTTPEKIAKGRDLFVHQWQPNDKLSPNGDGLGPLYNAKSCAECHSQGGVGGSGTNEHNAQMLAFLPEPGKFSQRNADAIRNRLKLMHPLFVDDQGRISTGVLLHRYSTNQDYDEVHQRITTPLEDSFESRGRLRRMLRERNLAAASSMPLQLVAYMREIQFATADRNPPQLFGANLIADGINESDIVAIADTQNKSSYQTGISGRKSGRFGWRGQLDDLDLFVKGACAAEVGLQVQEMLQAEDPTLPDYRLTGVDLEPSQTDELVAFVRSLPRPQQVLPEDPNMRSHVSQGQMLFNSIGCAQCHVEDVGAVSGVYSDFLLHNMGAEFEDPVPAARIPVTVVTARKLISMPMYYGGEYHRVETFTTIERRDEYQEYRTPPLWGVADSAPYLHDGRAETLREAIEWHGGEATISAARFMQLDEEQQFSVLQFLKSLKAPEIQKEEARQFTGNEGHLNDNKISSLVPGTMDSVASRE